MSTPEYEDSSLRAASSIVKSVCHHDAQKCKELTK